MWLHPLALGSAVEALRSGAGIFTDTRMIQVGLSPWRLQWFGNPVVTPVLEAETQRRAEEMGTTRSVAAFRQVGRRMDGQIVAVGNAPTALLEVIRLVEQDGVRPALVIGVPVGFVQAAESKEALHRLEDVPSITVKGRKGGSTVAVAILHALLEHARTDRNP
jgi:precorrin-8X/cobalt-precorrin-8 methylmutase